ncbi:BspA family leucine-rich repeat surface protein [Bifidobacterium aemilianum]|uniref:BspA family leucine-rich repeat surface protein n=1 Tax=Bifidobacterium aemilianum TaxID=2493120 RepID=UPI0038B33DA7
MTDLDQIDTSNTTDISFMFHSSKIPSLGVSNWDTSNVTTMGNMLPSRLRHLVLGGKKQLSDATFGGVNPYGSELTGRWALEDGTWSSQTGKQAWDFSQATNKDLDLYANGPPKPPNPATGTPGTAAASAAPATLAPPEPSNPHGTPIPDRPATPDPPPPAKARVTRSPWPAPPPASGCPCSPQA